MGGLTGSLSIALQSLFTQQEALQVTSNNIANAQTPGYSRQRAVLLEEPSIQLGSLQFGQGVKLEGIQSIRDAVLELRLNQETGSLGQLDSYLGAMNQVAATFNETSGTGLQGVLSQFFNSLQQLSTDPTNLSLRQSVLNAGQSLATAFNQASNTLSQLQTNLNQSIAPTVNQVNQLSTQIAALNPQISDTTGTAQASGTLVDQRTQLIRQLSGLIDVSVINDSNGAVDLSTAGGAALVVGNQSFALTVATDPGTGNEHIYSQARDITADLEAGQLGGVIQARDQGVATAQTNLDNLAAGLISAVNAQHAKGFDLNGVAGGNFFVPFTPPATGSTRGAAAQFSVAITDPAKVAASSDGTSSSNGNAQALAALQNGAVVSGQAPSVFYENLVAQVGSQVSDATTQQQTQNMIQQQLQTQRDNISGVSMDEEAANLQLYQTAYDAAARVVSVIDTLTQTTIAMGSGT